MMPESLMRVLTPMDWSVGNESRTPMSGPTTLSSLLHDWNDSVAAAIMTAAMLLICVILNFMFCLTEAKCCCFSCYANFLSSLDASKECF